MPGEEVQLERELVETPEAVVAECYRLIGFEPGSEPQWDRYRALFAPQAVMALRVFPDDEAVSIMNLDQYMVQQMREGMKEAGYEETTLREDWTKFGDVAQARVVFQMHFGKSEPIPALDILQLARRDGRWWIVSMISEVPKPGSVLLDELLTP